MVQFIFRVGHKKSYFSISIVIFVTRSTSKILVSLDRSFNELQSADVKMVDSLKFKMAAADENTSSLRSFFLFKTYLNYKTNKLFRKNFCLCQFSLWGDIANQLRSFLPFSNLGQNKIIAYFCLPMFRF